MIIKPHTLERIDGNSFGRVYHIPDTEYYFPSVTTILSKKPNPKLDEIKISMGIEKFEARRDFAARRGTVMHSYLEYFLISYTSGNSPEQALIFAQDEVMRTLPDKWDKEHKVGQHLFYNFYHSEIWKQINKLVFSEEFMHTTFKGGWAGAADFAFIDHNGKLVLWDFKSSSDMKLEEDISGYFMQVSAYMFLYADKQLDKTPPDLGQIIMMNEKDSNSQVFELPVSNMKIHLKEFIHYLGVFQEDPDWKDFIKAKQIQPVII